MSQLLGDARGGEDLALLALEQHGYSEPEITRRGDEFVAVAYKTIGGNTYKAEAIGRSRTEAVASLARTITRR